MKKYVALLSISVLTSMPFIADANISNLRELAELILGYFNLAVILIIALAVVMFVWNVFKYFIAGGDNAESKKEAGLYVMWSIIGFFVILSLWGLVFILTNTFKLQNGMPQNFFGTFNRSSTSGTQPGWTQGGSVNNPAQGGSVNNPAQGGSVNNPAQGKDSQSSFKIDSYVW